MRINLKIKDIGEQKFFLQPYGQLGDTSNVNYILIRCMKEIDSPMIKLVLKIEEQRFDVELKCEIDEIDSVFQEKMNHLAIEVMEAIQQGTDLAAEDIPEELQTVKPYDPDLIRVEPSTLSLRQVNDMIKDGDINLSPDFQRNAIWDNQRKCRLIESILLRIPLPVFYFSADETGLLSVVDGLQRLTAIKEFMNNELPLADLEYLDDCLNCTYNGKNKLDDRLYRRFNLTQITVNVIDASSPTKVKYDIFRRLNTGGRPLNSQELRNCLSSEALRSALKIMARSEAFRLATTGSISDDRMDAQECALRFMYFRYLYLNKSRSIETYSGMMDNDLDAFVDMVSKNKFFPFDTYIADYEKAMFNAAYLMGRHAFRKVFAETEYGSYRSVINKALFLSLSVLLADYEVDIVKSKCDEHSWVELLGKQISGDDYLFSMLSYGTNGWKNLVYCFGEIDKLIKSQLA